MILVAATGGTSVVGDILATIPGPTSSVPVMVRPDGPLPGRVGALDLVIPARSIPFALTPARVARSVVLLLLASASGCGH